MINMKNKLGEIILKKKTEWVFKGLPWCVLIDHVDKAAVLV